MFNLIKNKGTPDFYIDKIQIYSKRKKSEIVSWLPLRKLEANSYRTQLRHNPKFKGGYKSVIDGAFMSQEWIKVLVDETSDKGKKNLGEYAIGYLELSYEWTMSSHSEGRSFAKILSNKVKKNHSLNLRGLRVREGKQDNHRYYYAACEPKECKVNLVIYNRESKSNLLPITKIEWRLRSSRVIGSYTGIYEIQDILDFKCQEYFELNLNLENINYDEISKWMNPNNVKITHNNKRPFKTMHAGRLFCRLKRIRTSHDLRCFLRRKRMMLKIKRQPSNFDKKYLNLTPYQIDKMFIEVMND